MEETLKSAVCNQLIQQQAVATQTRLIQQPQADRTTSPCVCLSLCVSVPVCVCSCADPIEEAVKRGSAQQT